MKTLLLIRSLASMPTAEMQQLLGLVLLRSTSALGSSGSDGADAPHLMSSLLMAYFSVRLFQIDYSTLDIVLMSNTLPHWLCVRREAAQLLVEQRILRRLGQG